MKGQVKKVVLNVIEIVLAFAIFAGGLWLFLTAVSNKAYADDIWEWRCDAREGSVVFEDGRYGVIPELEPYTLYTDSRGAEAYGWEITEGIRLMMLECGSSTVSEADKREHCAVLCKQLLYTQTVGGYNGWGVTLWGVMHAGNSYLQTAPRVWNDEAEPTDEIAAIFWDVWCNGYSSDFRVQNYRTNYYFEGDWSTPAYRIGDTYYSINNWQDFSMFEIWTPGPVER